MQILKSEESDSQVFQAKIKNVVDCSALHSTRDQVFLSKEEFIKKELDDMDAVIPKAFLFQASLKYILGVRM